MVLSVHGHIFSFGYDPLHIPIGLFDILISSPSSALTSRNCLFGELGVGGFTEMWEPTQVRGELSQKRVMTIVAGHSHNLCMTEDYEVRSALSFAPQ
jgi:hypothetical protein